MIQSRLESVFQALIDGLDGTPFTGNALALLQSANAQTYLNASGKYTSIDQVGDPDLPFLHLKSGSFQSAEWDRYQIQVMWDIEGELKVKAPPGDAGKTIRSCMEDLYAQVTKLRGLYVDENYKVYPYSFDAIKAWRQGLIQPLAFRGGPFLRSFRLRPGQSSHYAVADLVFHVEFIDDFDPTQQGGQFQGTGATPSVPVTVFSIGTIPRPPDGAYPLADPYQDFKYQIPIPAPAADTVKQGRPSGPDDTFPKGIVRNPAIFPPGYKAPKDVAYTDLIKQVMVNPPTATIAHTSTQQLSAIAFAISGASQDVTASANWSSSDVTKATVNSSGLVTGVAAGTVTITASYGGQSGTSVITLT